MKYNPNKHHRRSIRLKGYDYHNAGAYFVTICTQNREHVLEDSIVNGIIHDVWFALPLWFPTIALDEFVVMPNHTHCVVWNTVGATLAVAQNAVAQNAVIPDGYTPKIRARTGANPVPTSWVIPEPEKIIPAPSLSDIVGAFKSLVFNVYLDWVKINDPSRRAKFWQRNYYEHIVRNERELNAIRQYIIDNPDNWQVDRDNRDNVRKLPFPEKAEDYLQDAIEMFDNQTRTSYSA
jgi:REP element-mobilizing transposase RayT